jgi:hypothetical protein
VIGLVIFVGLLYPAFGLLTKTNNFKPTFGFTLNDFDRFQRENPDDAAAIQFLLTAPHGIVAEAVGDSYTACLFTSLHLHRVANRPRLAGTKPNGAAV